MCHTGVNPRLGRRERDLTGRTLGEARYIRRGRFGRGRVVNMPTDSIVSDDEQSLHQVLVGKFGSNVFLATYDYLSEIVSTSLGYRTFV